MGGWEIAAWVMVGLVMVFRMALVLGVIALVTAIVRAVRRPQVAVPADPMPQIK